MESHKNSCSKAPTSGGFQNPTTLLEARQETLIFMGSALKGNMALAVAPSIGNEPHLPIFYPFVMVKNKGFLPFPTCFPEFNISSNFFARFFPFFPDPPQFSHVFPGFFHLFPSPSQAPKRCGHSADLQLLLGQAKATAAGRLHAQGLVQDGLEVPGEGWVFR